MAVAATGALYAGENFAGDNISGVIHPQRTGMTSEPYRRLVELSPDGILISQDDRLVFANQAAARLCGVADPAELARRAAARVFGADGHGSAGRASSA